MRMGFLRSINERNVNGAYAAGLRWLANRGETSGSRGGNVVVSAEPVVTVYSRPCERVLFSPMRDANPFFHLMEGLWMLAGRDDVAWPTQFNSTFGQFSDDGKVFHGAYGFRWRSWFGFDQLDWIVSELKANPDSRRAVLAMWDASKDPHRAMGGGKDVPCNTHIYFRVRGEMLDMMINCRSNDIIWGAYGANAVHMSMLMEYVAAAIGRGVGFMYQNSFNYHAYTDRFPLNQFAAMAEDAEKHDLYASGRVSPSALMSTDARLWNEELRLFMAWADNPDPDNTQIPVFQDPFFNGVAVPVRMAWLMHKAKKYKVAFHYSDDITATDWHHACRNWLKLRAEKNRLATEGTTNGL